MNISTIRKSLLNEAQTSPNLLSDLAGLESYISESYNNRSFIELLQNADDAGSTRFAVSRHGDYLIVANNGRVFNQQDIESLCRSASSSKVRGSAIGYRGIGFKSVVSIAKEVHIISGDLEITFSRELTKELIPNANRVPLIRIPHAIRDSVVAELRETIESLKSGGYTTIFIFSDVVGDIIGEEFINLKPTSLLFLNHIEETIIDVDKRIISTINHTQINQSVRSVQIKYNDVKAGWLVHTSNNCSIAFSVKSGEVIRLPKSEATIHAFLPTEDFCGLGVIVNGDFSTDPSRRHLIMDDTTKSVTNELCSIYLKLLSNYLFDVGSDNKDMVSALMPYFDMRMLQLTKQGFEKLFGESLKTNAGKSFSSLKLLPSWFNAKDFNLIMDQQGFKRMGDNIYNVLDILPLLKYLGAKEATPQAIITPIINDVDISVQGCVQLVQASIKATLMGDKIPQLKDVEMFYSNNKRVSLNYLQANASTIDTSFVGLLMGRGVTRDDINKFATKLSLSTLMPTSEVDNFAQSNTVAVESTSNSVSNWYNNIASSTPKPKSDDGNLSLQRWRSAEEQTLRALNSKGFKLEDVSTQNLGYDLEGLDPNGRKIYIEVKSITVAGQKFRVTNNEFGVAQIKQDAYFIALVLQEKDEFNISLIKNPANTLDLNRQCVQWIWECSSYEFDPFKFRFDN